jgi:hypothetical protein
MCRCFSSRFSQFPLTPAQFERTAPGRSFQSAPSRSDVGQHRQAEPRSRCVASVVPIPTKLIYIYTQYEYFLFWYRIMPICGLVAPSSFVASHGHLQYISVRLGPESHHSTTCIRHIIPQLTTLTAFTRDAISLACEHCSIRSHCQSLKRCCQLPRRSWDSSRLPYFPLWRHLIDPL